MRLPFIFVVISCGLLSGQTLLKGPSPGSPPTLFVADEAVLEGRESRRDLPCSVRPSKPDLDFDFGFHAGYDVIVPLGALAGQGNQLSVIFRVISVGAERRSYYFSQQWVVPALEEDVDGHAELTGAFILGPGKYEVDWLMRDRAERFCSAHWTVSVVPRGKDLLIPLRMGQGAVKPAVNDLFAAEEPVDRDTENGVRTLVLVHVAPQVPNAAEIGSDEMRVLVSILRNIAHEPKIGRYSIVAFNIEHRAVIHRQDNASAIDFPALGESLARLKLGTVSLKSLQQAADQPQFLAKLLATEMAGGPQDAVIFVGARRPFYAEGVRDSLRELGNPGCPVFYLNYNVQPNPDPWRDLIGVFVRFWKGVEYTIARPHELSTRWSAIMAAISQSRPRHAALNSRP